MSQEIDLIPASYRVRLKIQRWCYLFLLALSLIVVLTFFLRFSLNNKNKSIQHSISALKRDKSFNIQQQQTYNELLAVERRLNKNLEILDGLRGGASVRKILIVIDRVLNNNIWFLHWSFARAGEIADLSPGTVQTGYFIIIPQENSRVGKQQSWKLETHMEIKGQARDHTSFSLFVRELLNQVEIDDVKVVDTQMREYANIKVVDFNIVVVVNNRQNKSHV